MNNKTIYMTYHSQLPPVVTKRWLDLNPEYKIDFSLDAECIQFIDSELTRSIAELFIHIHRGMYKADLWRLCKLYIHGGVYADIDLVPFAPISMMTSVPSVTFYSYLSLCDDSIFQALMVHSRKRSPLLLGFLISFILNKPYMMIDNGPTNDMYEFILYNVRAQAAAMVVTATTAVPSIPTKLQPYVYYTLPQIYIPVTVSSLKGSQLIHLYYFPPSIKYTLHIHPKSQNKWVIANQDKLVMKIANHCLRVHLVDAGADADAADAGVDIHSSFIVDICIQLPDNEPEVIYLFQECIREPPRISTCYIADCNGKNIMDCRDPNYIRDRGWINQ
jgi:mannosyltransferase OCH1-like enzyme